MPLAKLGPGFWGEVSAVGIPRDESFVSCWGSGR